MWLSVLALLKETFAVLKNKNINRLLILAMFNVSFHFASSKENKVNFICGSAQPFYFQAE